MANSFSPFSYYPEVLAFGIPNLLATIFVDYFISNPLFAVFLKGSFKICQPIKT
jgi:hypothetical protein